MKKIIIAGITALMLSACATPTPVNYSAVGGSKADGTVKMAYEHSIYVDPVVDENQAIEAAKRRCAAWGYTNVEAFGGVSRSCTGQDPLTGGCGGYQVTKEFQCLD